MNAQRSMTDEQAKRLEEIRVRAERASRGPWAWAGNQKYHTIELSNWEPGWGRCTVLRAERAGMQSAEFGFRDDHMMRVRARDLAIFEVAPEATRADDPRVYRHDVIGLRHPDADFIAHARDDIPFLLELLGGTL